MVAGLWRWGFEELLRRQREFPALDGEIQTVEATTEDGNIVLTVNAQWRNRGRLPIEIDTRKTFLKVYPIKPPLQIGPFHPQSLNPGYSANPLSDSVGYILEPGTDSVMQQCLVLPPGQMFVLHWGICIAAKQQAYRYLKSEMWCVRYHLWRSAAAPEATISVDQKQLDTPRSQRIPPTQEQLDAMLRKHLSFEINRFRLATSLWSEHKYDRLADAMIRESCLIHMRLLLDFFYPRRDPQRSRHQDMYVTDYLPSRTALSPQFQKLLTPPNWLQSYRDELD